MLYCILRHKPKLFIQYYCQQKLAQSIVPFKLVLNKTMATKVNMEFANFDAKLSLHNPIVDYTKLMEDKMKADVVMPNDVYRECWKKISAATRETIWKMLFDEKNCSQKDLEKASELLKLHKSDACFYQASEYNNWIVLVRNELLKRKMIDFWKNEIVQKELGPCWARDSDLFDDTEDPEPANFYKYADCEAPWLKKKTKDVTQNISNSSPAYIAPLPLSNTDTPKREKILKKLSIETPLEDYKYNMETQSELADDDDEGYNKIFAEARNMVWQLLFGQEKLTEEDSKKAAGLLEEYKRDACFYCPWDYNDWIPKVKNELVKRKYFDFWQDVVVKNELGLCWAGDSDYFDDLEDTEPLEFYKLEEYSVKDDNK